MRIGLASAVACGAVSVATVGAIATTSRHHHPHVTPIVIRTHHKVCKHTVINGINDKGTAILTAYCGVSKAYVRSKSGTLTPITLPRGDGRYVEGSNISSNGILVVVGHRTATSRATSYLIEKDGSILTASYPGAIHSTILNGINRHGTAVGYYCLNHKCSLQQPFVYHHGIFRNFTLHRKHAVLPSLSAISDNGTLSGFFFQQPQGYLRGFVKKGHHIRVVDAPKAGRKLAQGTIILGAANHRAICGDVFGKHQLSAAFVEYRGHMHLLNFHPSPRKSFTELFACNSHGEIGGRSYNARTHLNEGFLSKVH